MNEASRNPTNNPQDAVQGPPRPSVGEPKDVAREGVHVALRPDSQTGDGRYPLAWLCIRAPRGATPTATSKCLCGRDRSAVGHKRVHALIADHTAHRDACPLSNPQEGRDVA
jgi:hypothetical protein